MLRSQRIWSKEHCFNICLMSTMNAFEYVFPLIGGNFINDGTNRVLTKQVYGTAFYIKNNYFITASHVVKGALANNEYIGLGYKDSNSISNLNSAKILDYETIDDYDIGFVKAEILVAKALSWDFNQLSMLDNVQTVGFPYALDLQNFMIHIRSLKGYIVSNRQFDRLSPKPWCYELSFHCPVGISGAPLFDSKVKGIIIGETDTEVLMDSKETEIITENKEKNVYEKYKTTSWGISVQTRSLQNIKSRILEGTIGEYLQRVNLI